MLRAITMHVPPRTSPPLSLLSPFFFLFFFLSCSTSTWCTHTPQRFDGPCGMNLEMTYRPSSTILAAQPWSDFSAGAMLVRRTVICTLSSLPICSQWPGYLTIPCSPFLFHRHHPAPLITFPRTLQFSGMNAWFASQTAPPRVLTIQNRAVMRYSLAVIASLFRSSESASSRGSGAPFTSEVQRRGTPCLSRPSCVRPLPSTTPHCNPLVLIPRLHASDYCHCQSSFVVVLHLHMPTESTKEERDPAGLTASMAGVQFLPRKPIRSVLFH